MNLFLLGASAAVVIPSQAPTRNADGAAVFAALAAMAQVPVTPRLYPGVSNPTPVTFRGATVFVPLGTTTTQPQAISDELAGMGLL